MTEEMSLHGWNKRNNKKNDCDEVHEMKQEVYSKGKAMHIKMSK